MTVTVRAPSVAPATITKLAVSDVVLVTTTLLIVTLPPLTFTVVAPTTKLVPVSVTATVVPTTPWLGTTVVSVGAPGAGALTVNVCPPLVPPLVVTVTECAPMCAPQLRSQPSTTLRCYDDLLIVASAATDRHSCRADNEVRAGQRHRDCAALDALSRRDDRQRRRGPAAAPH